MNKTNIIPLFLAALALSGCSGKEKDGSSKKTEESIPVVKVETVHSRVVDQLGTYTATVEAQIINNISSSMPNRIKQILVDESTRVAAGQRVVVLDDVNTFSYETQVDNARANLKNVQLNYNRALELYKIGGGTKQQVDNMEIQLTNARNALSQAERTLRNARENTVAHLSDIRCGDSPQLRSGRYDRQSSNTHRGTHTACETCSECHRKRTSQSA